MFYHLTTTRFEVTLLRFENTMHCEKSAERLALRLFVSILGIVLIPWRVFLSEHRLVRTRFRADSLIRVVIDVTNWRISDPSHYEPTLSKLPKTSFLEIFVIMWNVSCQESELNWRRRIGSPENCHYSIEAFERSRNWTNNLLLVRQMLCQLSYPFAKWNNFF